MGSIGQKNATSSGSSNGTSTTTFSPQVQQAYNGLLSQIGGTSATNAPTTAATTGLGTLASSSNPSFGTAANTLGTAATPAYDNISNYLSPYLTGALQTQIASQNLQNGQQQQQLLGNAAAQGALGGNRVGVAQGQLAGQQDIANNAANSSLINSAYQSAENAALQGQSNTTAAGTAQAGLGTASNSASLGNLLGLLQAGSQPYTNLGSLASSAEGLSQSGATTTSSGSTTASVPNGNILSSLLGIAGLFVPNKANGGEVRGFDAGGVAGNEESTRLAGLVGAETGSADAISQLQQLVSQQNQVQPTAQEKQGAANLGSWILPAAHAFGGRVRGYDVGGSVGDEGTPLSVRNNNPGDLTDSPWTEAQPGFAGVNNGFAVFASPNAGAAAMTGLLGNYVKGGTNTINGIVNKWAPPSTNDPASTQNYASYVAQRTGVDPTKPVSLGDIPQIAGAMSEFESGARPKGPVAGLGSGPQVAQAAVPSLGSMPPSANDNAASAANDNQYSPDAISAVQSLLGGHGLNLSPDAYQGFLAGAAALAGSTNPNVLTGIGQAASTGIDSYRQRQALNAELALKAAQTGAQQAQAGKTGVEAAMAGTTFEQNGLAFTKKAVQPDGSVGIGRLPFGNVPVLGGASGGSSGATTVGAGGSGGPSQTPAVSATDVPSFQPQEFPAQVNTNAGLTGLQTTGNDQFVAPAVQAATNAHQLDTSLSQLMALAQKLPQSGPLTLGAGLNDRTSWANAANTAMKILGQKPIFNADDLATAEGIKKISTNLQAALADTWKSDPASNDIALASSGSPSGENTAAGLPEIIGTAMAVNRRAEDRANYFNRWSGQNYGVLNGFPKGSADDYFNAAHPPQTYVDMGKAIGGWLGGKPVSVSSPDVYSGLPSGAIYIGPDGKQHRKQ